MDLIFDYNNGTNRFSLKRAFEWWSYRILVILASNVKIWIRSRISSCRWLSRPLFDRDYWQKIVQLSSLYASLIELLTSVPKRHSSPWYGRCKSRYGRYEMQCHFDLLSSSCKAVACWEGGAALQIFRKQGDLSNSNDLIINLLHSYYIREEENSHEPRQRSFQISGSAGRCIIDPLSRDEIMTQLHHDHDDELPRR